MLHSCKRSAENAQRDAETHKPIAQRCASTLRKALMLGAREGRQNGLHTNLVTGHFAHSDSPVLKRRFSTARHCIAFTGLHYTAFRFVLWHPLGSPAKGLSAFGRNSTYPMAPGHEHWRLVQPLRLESLQDLILLTAGRICYSLLVSFKKLSDSGNSTAALAHQGSHVCQTTNTPASPK